MAGQLIPVLSLVVAHPVLAAGRDPEVAPDPAVALVRVVPLTQAPPGWLELEEQILTRARERLPTPPAPASFAADLWRIPGFRFDRVQWRIRQALAAAEIALADGKPKTALTHLLDNHELLALGGAVAVMPKAILRHQHRLLARAHGALKNREAKRAARTFVGLLGVEPDEALLAEAKRETSASDSSGLVVEAKRGGAVFFLDGIQIGEGTLRRYDLPPGLHYLRVVAPGRAAFGERLRLRPGEIARRKARLESAANPKRALAAALLAAQPEASAADEIAEVAAKTGATTLLLLIPSSAGVTLRRFETSGGRFLPAYPVPFGSTADPIAAAVDDALGLAPELLPAEVVSAKPVNMATAPDAVTTESEPSLVMSPWLWAGFGAGLVVVGGIVAIVAASASPNEPARAPVYLCPRTGPCAP